MIAIASLSLLFSFYRITPNIRPGRYIRYNAHPDSKTDEILSAYNARCNRVRSSSITTGTRSAVSERPSPPQICTKDVGTSVPKKSGS